jgi:hypothetical protein
MFKENTTHFQQSLFGIENQLSESKRKKLQQSKEAVFYKLIFCSIDENDFIPLFSDKGSRPNAPVNALVASILLQNNNGWTGEKLLKRIDFDLLTRKALGLHDIDETPFCETTFYNFQNKMLKHFTRTGENLLETVFDKLSSQQLKKLKIKTNIQRMDSFQALSNIRRYSRVQLLVEMLIRLYRVLDDKERKRFQELLSPYTSKKTSSKFIYSLKRSDITHELEKLGHVYHQLHESLKDTYSDIEIFRVFERVYTEHFTVVSDRIEIKDSKELSSGILQSPDDLDATYRHKNGNNYYGQVVNITETANPDNELNLITDVSVDSNNTDDSAILNNSIEKIKNKTPDLEELHTDGAYGSSENDIKMEESGITHVQTAVRGSTPDVKMEIDEVSEEEYTVHCPTQTVTAKKTKKRYKASFNIQKCATCLHVKECPTIKQKNSRVYYFDDKMVRLSKRIRNIENIPLERRKIRPNIEATVKEYTKGFNHKGKLRVRGKFKTMVFAFTMSTVINFGRIYRYIMEKPEKIVDLSGVLDTSKPIISFFGSMISCLKRCLGFSIPNFQRAMATYYYL